MSVLTHYWFPYIDKEGNRHRKYQPTTENTADENGSMDRKNRPTDSTVDENGNMDRKDHPTEYVFHW